jgi:hypothetical protein
METFMHTTIATPSSDRYRLHPPTLASLLQVPHNALMDVDVARMNLLCSEGLVDEDKFDVEDNIRRIDDLAFEVASFTDSSTDLLEQFDDVLQGSEVLWRLYCLARGLILVGEIEYCLEERELETDADWTKADRHLIHGLLGPTRHGTCASMPVLYVAVGRRLGYPLYLVHSPGHVFARWHGMNHPLLEWRERRNAEFTSGFESYADEEYFESPRKWSREIHEMERLRQPNPLYLRNLNSSEEFASCLVQRAHAFEALNGFENAMAAYGFAHKLAPHNDTYVFFSRECSRMHIDSILTPFHMRAPAFTRIVEKKWRGENATFPWEDDPRIGNPLNDASSGPVLRAVQFAIQERLSGKNHNAPAQQFLIDFLKSTPEDNCKSYDLVDAVFSDCSFTSKD